MTDYTFRPAVIQDSPSLARIQVDSYRGAYAAIMPQDYLDQFTYEEQEQDWRELLSEESPDILLVAERPDGQLAGYTLGRPVLTDLDGYDSELVALHVRRSEQGLGAGCGLMVAMAGRLQERGCRAMMLWVPAANDSAQTFYLRLGGQRLDAGRTTSTGAIELAFGWPDIGRLTGRED
jgi:ribosomal protein S18 acetylase RimI-like enzyme